MCSALKSTIRAMAVCLASLALPAYAAEGGQEGETPKKSYDEKDKNAELTLIEKENYYVGEIIVTGRRVANMEQAGTTTIIDSEDIAAHGDKNLRQTLERIPGLQVSMFRKGHARVRLRGFDQRNLLILLDGVPLHDVYSTDLDIESISVLNVSKIIVNRGVSSALYGTDGAVGTINVITKKPSEPIIQAGTEYGFFNQATHNLMFGAPVGDFYYWFQGTMTHSDGFRPSKRLDKKKRRAWFYKIVPYDLYPVEGPFEDPPYNTLDDVAVPAKDQYINDEGLWDHSDYSRFYLSAKAGYQLSPDFEFGISSDFSLFKGNTNTYQPNCYNSYRGDQWKTKYPNFGNDQDDVKQFALRNRAFEWPGIYRLGVFPYVRGRIKKFSVKLIPFFLHQKSKQRGYASTDHSYVKGDTYLLKNSGTIEPFNDYKTFQGFGVWLFPSYEFAKWHRLNLGLQWRTDKYLGHEQAVSPAVSPEIYRLMGRGQYPVEDLRTHTVSIGIEDEMKLWNRLKLAIGISYDAQFFTTFKQRENEEYGELYIVDDDATIVGTRDSFNPAVGLIADPVKRRLRLRTAFAMKTRFPTLSEYAKVASEGEDEHLEPERSYNANAGFELFFMNKLMSFRSDYFFTMIDDRIIKIAKDEPPRNMDRTLSQGVENIFASETGKLGKLDNIVTSLAYTFVHARNKDYSKNSAVNKGDYLEFTPVHHITADIRLIFVSKTALDLWATVTLNQIIYVMDHRPTQQVSDYSTDYFKAVELHNPVFLNAKISQDVKETVTVYLLVRNILDDYNADPFDPGPGRMFYLGLSARWH